VNVAAIADTMIEAELFGSVKGAFTDAKAHRLGYLASSDGGTLLLDEIGELRIEHQPKLLRVLEERRFFAVGSDRERSVDVRILAATNREPEEMMARGLLRRDLFYRLGIVIRIPPLRERRDEILSLANHFARHFCTDFGRAPMGLSAAAQRLLLTHAWPGNVRELRNSMERAVMLTEGDTIEAEALDIVHASGTRRVSVAPPSGPPALVPALANLSLTHARQPAIEQLERERILEALRVSKGRRSRAAVALGIARSTLYEKLRRYGIA
jgi:DNA-binding NtrC family response regulator